MFSIIVPSYNEAAQIGATIASIRDAAMGTVHEIIVADGGSDDGTVQIATDAGALVLQCPRKGRAAQMNFGATHARYAVLYFLHADSLPPPHFLGFIQNALNAGASAGCFRLAFDHHHWFLKANAWFTRFNCNAVRFGDQSLFVRKDVFGKAGRFREDLLMMEDQEIVHRLRKHGDFVVLHQKVTTSARKYLDNGFYRMQVIFFAIWLMYYLGFPQQRILAFHRRVIRRHKL